MLYKKVNGYKKSLPFLRRIILILGFVVDFYLFDSLVVRSAEIIL